MIFTLLLAAGLIALVVWLVRRAYAQRNVGIEINAALPWAPQDATGHVPCPVPADLAEAIPSARGC